MSDDFNPYHKWLGIPPAEQPADHYRLLGVAQLESDPDVIAMAADQRMTFLRTFQSGEQSALSQRLLNEVAAAKICLLNAKEKARYDAELARKKPPDAPPPLPAGDDSQSAFAAFAVGSQTDSASSRSRGSTKDKAGLQKKKTRVPVVAIAVVILLVIVLAGLILWGKEKKGSEQRKPVAAVELPPRESRQAATPAKKAPVRANTRVSKPKRNGAGRTNSRHTQDAEYESQAQATGPDATSAPKARDKPEPAAQEQQRLAQRAKRKAARQAAAEKEAERQQQAAAAKIAAAERKKKAEAAKIAEAERKAKEKLKREAPAIQDNPESLLESKGLVKKDSTWILAIEGPLQKRAQTLQTQWKQIKGLRRQFVGVDKKIATNYLLRYHELLEQTRSYRAMRAAVAEDYGKILEDEQIMAALEKLGQNTKSLPRTIKQYEKPDKKLRQVFPKGPPQIGNFVLLIINETTPVVIEQDTTKLQHKEAKTLLILPRAGWEAAGLPPGTPTQKRMHAQWQPKLWEVEVPSLRWGPAIAKNAKAYRMDSYPENQDKAYGGRVGPVGWQTFLQQLRPAPTPPPTAEQIAAARTKLAKAGRQASVAEKKIAKTQRKERQAKAKKEKAEAEQKAEKKEQLKQAKRKAEAALAALKLERQKGEKGEPIWYLQNDEATEYKKLQDDHTAEQIEPLEASREALLQEYAKLDNDPEVKKHLQRVGGVLATENDLPFWPEEVRDALKEEGLLERDTDEGNFWILADEAKFLESVEKLDAQRDEFFEHRKKGTKGKEEAKEKIESFSKDFSSAKEQYEALSQKYEELDGKDELIAKIESLGNRLGPSLTAAAWQKKQKYFAKVVKNLSRSRSAGRLPKRIFESSAILQLDGTDETQDAKTGEIAQPPTITAEAVVRVKKGRKYGAIVGQALDNVRTEQGWQLGYNQNDFQFRIGPVGDRHEGHQATSKTTHQRQKAHHVVGTYDGRIVRLYVDGKPESEGKPFGRRAPINYPPQASSPFTIGAHKDNDEYLELNGTIFLVRVYAGPLTDAQVAARYNEVKEKIDELNNAP